MIIVNQVHIYGQRDELANHISEVVVLTTDRGDRDVNKDGKHLNLNRVLMANK